jgi:hypothetical protein
LFFICVSASAFFILVSKKSAKASGIWGGFISSPLWNSGEGIASLFKSFAIFTAVQRDLVFPGIITLRTEFLFWVR